MSIHNITSCDQILTMDQMKSIFKESSHQLNDISTAVHYCDNEIDHAELFFDFFIDGESVIDFTLNDLENEIKNNG